MQHVYVIGSKGLPGSYGGYETFLDKLTEYHQNNRNIQYHVACKANGDGVSPELRSMPDRFKYHNADCFKIHVPEVGAAQAIYYDCMALDYCVKHIRRHGIKNAIVYVLACRIGPFFAHYVSEIHKLGGKVFVNPDGHEWMRAKWSKPVREYWKISEKLMIKHADLIICDSKNIELYIQETYKKYNPNTTYIAYGAETKKSTLSDESTELVNWYKEHDIKKKKYYLVVGRFVPENNFETIIREFMKSESKKDLVIISTKNDSLLNELDSVHGFSKDSRIKFVGTVYNQELLKKIRENAYGYVHGHSVGGTNPSLLEALGATELNLLYNVGFNRECAEEGALYWNKEFGNLSDLFNKADALSSEQISLLGMKAKKRIRDSYSWKFISDRYEEVFIDNNEIAEAPAISMGAIKSA
jgi:rhamnosyltransferase